jgi:hypothetical protein
MIWLRDLGDDLRYAVRPFAKEPGLLNGFHRHE